MSKTDVKRYQLSTNVGTYQTLVVISLSMKSASQRTFSDCSLSQCRHEKKRRTKQANERPRRATHPALIQHEYSSTQQRPFLHLLSTSYGGFAFGRGCFQVTRVSDEPTTCGHLKREHRPPSPGGGDRLIGQVHDEPRQVALSQAATFKKFAYSIVPFLVMSLLWPRST